MKLQHRARPAMIAALDRALSADGASALDPTVPSHVWRRALSGPAVEFLARPGKALRTTIVTAGWLLGGGAPDAMPDRLPLVIEILHAGSLIVDDVEDGSDERRGAPTLHRLVGVPLAINTGSWMYFWALAELAQLGLAPEIELAAHRCATSTLVRCHQGQALDLATRIDTLAIEEVPAVVAATTRLKTGVLCRFGAELGALAAGGAQRAAIASFGEAMGIGLQMLDDLGSLTSDARLDKGREDLRERRPTWPWAWLAEDPAAFAEVAAIGDIDVTAAALVERIGVKGRARIRAALDGALAQLVSAVGTSRVTDMIGAELSRMETSYG
ncbi:MAG: polyprenyl synthetase family protein [Myxococcota bacterium]|nr:polyprenyl synthetase family protein [Deltaproteobacteria bacterium]MDQ3335544.1 polyprenyl synthetase family protein [Myxococcota bacterium]